MQIFNRVRMGLAALLVLGSSVTAMAAPQENAAAYLSQAYTQMDAITSEAFTVNGVAVSPMGQINFAANGKAIVKPQLLLQADMNVTMNGLLGQKLSLATPCYMEETDKAFIAYYQNNGKWVKQTMKKDAKTAGIETIKSSDILPLLRGVELTADTPEERVLKVTVDGQKLEAAVRDSVLAQNKGKKVSAQDKAMQAQAEKIFNAIGDVELTLHIDKSTGYIVKSEANLTTPLRNIANAFIADLAKVKPADKQKAQDMINNTTLQVESTDSEFNTVTAITIPADVRAAKEAVPMTPKAPEKTDKKTAA